jgi:hypothetical protein
VSGKHGFGGRLLAVDENRLGTCTKGISLTVTCARTFGKRCGVIYESILCRHTSRELITLRKFEKKQVIEITVLSAKAVELVRCGLVISRVFMEAQIAIRPGASAWMVIIFLFFSMAATAMEQPSHTGQVMGRPMKWASLECTISDRGALKITWGPEHELSVRVEDFAALSENKELTLLIRDHRIGTVNFRFSDGWVVDKARHSESACRLRMTDITGSPLTFRASISCKNLLPADIADGGLLDVSVSPSSQSMVCAQAR